jgi:HK97 family phage major capsid protein
MHNLKKLLEQRSALIEKMNGMLAKLDEGGETRAFTDEELAEFNEAKSQVKSLTDTINAADEQRGMEAFKPADGENNEADAEKRALDEIRSFEKFLRSNGAAQMETRSDTNWTATANGAVLPTTIANKIIDKVKETSPLFSLATHYNIGGTLNIPYYDESTSEITVAYADEFNDLESSAGQFKSISLKGFLVGALSKISRSLINNSNFPIVDYVIGKIAEKFALWIDKELIKGTTDKIEGLSGITQVITTAASTVITADELIDAQDTVPDVFQPNCVWIMSKAARTAIRKLKDGEGNYLLNKDATTKWGYTLFGRPVYISDAVDSIAAGKTPIYYGDFSGLAVKISEGFSLQLLLEKYATQHAVGAVAWMELDAKIENAQKLVAIKMKTA